MTWADLTEALDVTGDVFMESPVLFAALMFLAALSTLAVGAVLWRLLTLPAALRRALRRTAKRPTDHHH